MSPLGIALLAAAAAARDDANGVGIAARLNDEVITWKDVDDRLKLDPKDITPAMRRSKLREVVEERLFLQWARKSNITVSDQEIDDHIRRELKTFQNEEQYDAWLRSRGMTKTENRERWRTQILVSKLTMYLVRKSWTNPDGDTPGLMQEYVPPEEVRRYYAEHPNQFKAIEHVTTWRIGLQFRTAAEEAAKRERAEAVLRKLEEGTDFYILAYHESDVWITKEERVYGHVGLKREEAGKFYAPETVKLLFETLKEGEISPIVKDGKTFYIFKLMQRVSQKEETFEAAQPKIRSFLEHQKREENRKRLRNELLKRALVVPENLFQD